MGLVLRLRRGQRLQPNGAVTGARLSREHNDANVIAFGARMIGVEPALEALRAFLATPYAGGRHDRRVLKLSPDWTRTP